MRRRVKRTRLRPRPFIIFALIVNVTVGAIYSPLTAIRRVKIEGVPEDDKKRVEGVVQSLYGVPCARVNPRGVESKVLENPELRVASLSRTPFGSARLSVVRRIPVARMAAKTPMGLAEDGVCFPTFTPLDGLPVVLLNKNLPVETLAIGNGWRSVDLAGLARAVKEDTEHHNVQIVLERGGRVCLNIDTGRIILGTYDRFQNKVDRVRQTLREHADLFADHRIINLEDPDSPIISEPKGATAP